MRTHTFVQKVAAVAITVAALTAVPAGQQRRGPYTLDDWMTITSVGSFVWSPDGQTIYFLSDRENKACLWKAPVSASAPKPEPLHEIPDGANRILGVSRDGGVDQLNLVLGAPPFEEVTQDFEPRLQIVSATVANGDDECVRGEWQPVDPLGE